MPTISAIIPVYNGEKTIQETIESVLNQTWFDLELIVINDGSQDSTLDIISSISDSRIKVFSYPNAGLAASRNRGISHASGEYIAFLDADDLWTPNKLESQWKALQENPQAAVAYSWTDCVDESGQFLRRGSYITVNGDAYSNLLLIDFLENGSSALIRRQAIDAVGGFDESLTAAEDWDLWLKLASRYHFVAVASAQILYRVSTDSMSANVWKMEAACLQVIERAFAVAPDSLQHLKKHSLGNIYKYLTFKSLAGFPERKRALAAIKLLWRAVKCDSDLLRSRVLLKVLVKILAIALLPPEQSQVLFAKFHKLFDTTTILGFLKTDPNSL